MLNVKYGEHTKPEELQELPAHIFKEILPKYGYKVREEQLKLAKNMLQNLTIRGTLLAEAGVGIGKTFAYLIAAILIKRGRINDFWNHGFYPEMSYLALADMPVVISTSSIALQKAIVTEYIPKLSHILQKEKIIDTPLSVVLRKGKEHYVCERKLRAHYTFETNFKTKKQLKELLKRNAPIDLAQVESLPQSTKKRICVEHCDDACPYILSCRYREFVSHAMNPKIDIQVCNHAYLLADTKRRAEKQKPLIPNYQAILIDEAHKFRQSAQQLYGYELESTTIPALKDDVFKIFGKDPQHKKLCRKAKKLADHNEKLFLAFQRSGFDYECLFTTRRIAELSQILKDEIHILDFPRKYSDMKNILTRRLEKLTSLSTALTQTSKLIYWGEKDNGVSVLHAQPNDLNERLHKDLWSRNLPSILTSGTLSANGDFSRTKQTLGIKPHCRLTETLSPSPFDYRQNAMLYISENTIFPDNQNISYLENITNEIERLIHASHGHAAVLFTSYKTMDIVWENIKDKLQFPLFRLERGDINAIENFKSSQNGVLFASGALWEGIDIPGDALSMLIIVKLPFPVPDAMSEYEQSLYYGMTEYKEKVIVPEMLIKLKQGFGRLIRSESDTGVIAILDCRVGANGAYRGVVIDTLPSCCVTSDVAEVESFFQSKKSPEYFTQGGSK